MTIEKKLRHIFIGILALLLIGCDDDYSTGYIWVLQESSSSFEWPFSSFEWPFSSALSSSSALAVVSSSANSSSSGQDSYEFVQIGSQEWMTENLNEPVNGERWCYAGFPSNCGEYGSLYTWSQAMGVDQKYDRERLGEISLPYRGICPQGSHLPSNEEWVELHDYIVAHPEYKAFFTNQIGGVYDWTGIYRSDGVETVFWTSTEYDATGTGYDFEFAWIWAYRKDGSIEFSNPHKYMGASVRCVRLVQDK